MVDELWLAWVATILLGGAGVRGRATERCGLAVPRPNRGRVDIKRAEDPFGGVSFQALRASAERMPQTAFRLV